MSIKMNETKMIWRSIGNGRSSAEKCTARKPVEGTVPVGIRKEATERGWSTPGQHPPVGAMTWPLRVRCNARRNRRSRLDGRPTSRISREASRIPRRRVRPVHGRPVRARFVLCLNSCLDSPTPWAHETRENNVHRVLVCPRTAQKYSTEQGRRSTHTWPVPDY